MPKLLTEQEVQRLIQEATAPLLARIAELEAKLARLQKDSSTSSKPPSSDIITTREEGSDRAQEEAGTRWAARTRAP
jgi:hypothetical protein